MNSAEHLLITGGSGFVGQSIIDHLSGLDFKDLPGKLSVSYFSNKPKIPILLSSKIEVEAIRVDLRAKWEIEIEPTHVINLAANGGTGSATSQASSDFIHITKNFTEWLQSRDVRVVFQASSGACFGYNELNLKLLDSPQSSKAISRETWNQGKGNISSSRAESENILKSARNDQGFNLQIGRLFTFSGKHLIMNKNYALSQFFQMADKNGMIEVSGHPNSMRSYMDARDMARWIYEAINKLPEIEYLQIGSNVSVTFAELAQYVGSLFQAEVSYTNELDGIEYYLPKNEATANLLGEKEIYSWKESVNYSFESYGR
jgi:nucleoside-diphosphate-sugar epimerase